MVFGIFALEEVATLGIMNPVILVSATFCLLFVTVFIIQELKAQVPFINIRIFSKWQFSSVLTAFLLINVLFMGTLYLLPFYLSAEMKFNLATIGMYLLIPPLNYRHPQYPFCPLVRSLWSQMVCRRCLPVAYCI
ncbi:hypothetical protein [Methanogenium cariaci]|uniref:hypothetical protein n=1 Tax=Methanogenium cariaci TaxID=2197 RepID=UPI000783ACD0|nr:hypothetical protein [Methanogenium cariaci]